MNFPNKVQSDGSVNNHKASLMMKGYAQLWLVYFSDTFALVARLDTVRMLGVNQFSEQSSIRWIGKQPQSQLGGEILCTSLRSTFFLILLPW